MIAPLKEADVDIFAVLDPSYYKQDGCIFLLDKVRMVLKKNYTTPHISRVEMDKQSPLGLVILW